MRMKNWKRFAAVAMSVMCMGTMVACGSSGSASNDSKTGSAGSSSKSQTITVVSREDGSGTRGAFIELFGIEEKDASGKKVDNTTDDATITNSTEVMMTTVAGDEAAIGYTSLGALNSSIKALKVDGAEATAANVKSGTYKISRPFNIATKGTVSEVTQDFINYILSEDGQKIVESNGYISQGNSGAFTSNGASGKIVVAGSSSVTGSQEMMSWGMIMFHVVIVSLLSNIGKLCPMFFYRDRKLSERLALSIGMFTRGEVGAGIIFIALGYNLGGPALVISVLTLVLNLILTGIFVLWVKNLALRSYAD